MWSRKSGPFLGGTALGRIFLAFGALFVIVGSYPLINSCSAFTNCNWFTAVSAGGRIIFSAVGGVFILGEFGGGRVEGFFFSHFLVVEEKTVRACWQGFRKNVNRGTKPSPLAHKN